MIPFPNKKYDVIYADPPWSYRLYNGTGNGPAAKHYKTMDAWGDEIEGGVIYAGKHERSKRNEHK